MHKTSDALYVKRSDFKEEIAGCSHPKPGIDINAIKCVEIDVAGFFQTNYMSHICEKIRESKWAWN